MSSNPQFCDEEIYQEIASINTSDSFISSRASETLTGYMLDYFLKV